LEKTPCFLFFLICPKPFFFNFIEEKLFYTYLGKKVFYGGKKFFLRRKQNHFSFNIERFFNKKKLFSVIVKKIRARPISSLFFFYIFFQKFKSQTFSEMELKCFDPWPKLVVAMKG